MSYQGPTGVKPTDAEAPNTTTSPLSPVKIHDLLGTERRHICIQILLETTGGVEFPDLVDEVAARENQASIEELDTGTRNSVKASLHQAHLPKLKDEGIAFYDRIGVNETIWRGPHADFVEPYLSVESAESEPAETDPTESETENTPANFVESVRAALSL